MQSSRVVELSAISLIAAFQVLQQNVMFNVSIDVWRRTETHSYGNQASASLRVKGRLTRDKDRFGRFEAVEMAFS